MSFGLPVAVLLLVTACGGGGVSQSEFEAVAGERNLAEVRLTESRVALAQLEDQVMTLEEKLRAAEIRAEISEGLRAEAEGRAAAEAFWAEFLASYDAAWSSGDVDAVLELYARDTVFEIPIRGTVRRGSDDVRLSFTNFLAGFVEYRQETSDVAVLDAGVAMVMWEATGRDLDGALVLLSGGTRLELDDDRRIVRHVDYATLP